MPTNLEVYVRKSFAFWLSQTTLTRVQAAIIFLKKLLATRIIEMLDKALEIKRRYDHVRRSWIKNRIDAWFYITPNGLLAKLKTVRGVYWSSYSDSLHPRWPEVVTIHYDFGSILLANGVFLDAKFHLRRLSCWSKMREKVLPRYSEFVNQEQRGVWFVHILRQIVTLTRTSQAENAIVRIRKHTSVIFANN